MDTVLYIECTVMCYIGLHIFSMSLEAYPYLGERSASAPVYARCFMLMDHL